MGAEDYYQSHDMEDYYSMTPIRAERIIEPFSGTLMFAPCNIYDTAVWGKCCKVGAFTEIGHNVEIGDNVTIGAMCFIPEGVTIEDGAWIGPRVCFTNDRFPPSDRSQWGKTIVRRGAKIGAGCVILCGHPGEVLEIGEGALVGAGSVVTRGVPAGETWCGNPAKKQQRAADAALITA